jgi:hypothetical protein
VQLEVAGAAALPAKPKRKKRPVEDESAGDAGPRKPALKLRTDLDPVQQSSAPAAESKSPVIAGNRLEESTIRAPLSRADRRKMKQERRMAS